MKYFKFNVWAISGLLFTFVGLVFTVFAIVCALNYDKFQYMVEEGSPVMFLVIFGVIGSVVTIVGTGILTWCIKDMLTSKRVYEAGEYLVLPISDIRLDTTVRINSRYMYLIEAQYTDPVTKEIYLFQSRRLIYNPASRLLTNMVNVYVNPSDYKHYYMDIDEIME